MAKRTAKLHSAPLFPSRPYNTTLPARTVQDRTFESLLEAALRDLGWETMQDRGIDRLDFHEVSVHRMRKLLRMAFDAGKRSQ